MTYRTLVDVDTVYAHLDDPTWVIVDCRFNLMDPAAGLRAYREGHIPGARHADLDRDLSAPRTATSGRHPLPDPARLAQTLGGWGIDEHTQVVAYDEGGGAIAARLWWLLGWLGHTRRAVLDGGLTAWRQQGLALATEPVEPSPASFRARPDDRLWVDSAAVLANVVNGDDRLLDVRAAPRFRGEVEPIDPVAGHVPNALNLPFDTLLDSTSRFLPPPALRERLAAVLDGHPPEKAIAMCGSGVTACHLLLALELAGFAGARLYAGSWSEWIRDPARPIAKASA